MLPNITIEAILQGHGIGSGGSGDGIKVVKGPTEPTTGLRNGLVWINTENNEPRIYLDGQFIYFGNGLGLYPYFGTVVVSAATNRISIPIENYFPASDILFVSQNTAQLMQTIHYDIDRQTKEIVKKTGTWEKDTHLFFMSLAPSPAAVANITIAVFERHMSVPSGTTNIVFDIPEFNNHTDELLVYQRNLPLFRNIDWTVGNDGQSVNLSTATVETMDFHFTVRKKVRLAPDMDQEVATQGDLRQHIFDPSPHYTTDGTNQYKYGFKVNPTTRELIFFWE